MCVYECGFMRVSRAARDAPILSHPPTILVQLSPPQYIDNYTMVLYLGGVELLGYVICVCLSVISDRQPS